MPYRAPNSPGHSAQQFLSGKPIRHYRPKGSPEIRRLVDEGFQAFNAGRLSEACEIFSDKMLDPAHDTTIGLTVAGALTPAGLGGCVIEMMDRGLVDFIISTGANLYHDLHYALNFTLRRGSPFVNDVELYEDGVIRIYDVLFPATVLLETDAYIRDFIVRSGLNEPIATSEFHYRLGGHLWDTTERDGILTAAYRANVPIFCPAIADSSIGMGLSQARQKKAGAGFIDIIGDIVESANLIIRRPRTASVVLGGGTPKNFINQACVQAEFYSPEVGGHRFALQIVTDVPHFGGASGSSLEEAQSWGKLATDAARVSVQADATVALPILASALATTAPPLLALRKMPVFSLASRVMTIDGLSVPTDRFEDVNEPAV